MHFIQNSRISHPPGEPAPHHEEGRHSNTQQESFQQEQEEQEGRHVGAVLRGDSASLPGRQQWALFPQPGDSPVLQPHATPHPHTIRPAPVCLFTLHTPPQHRHGAHTGVKSENWLHSGIVTLARLSNNKCGFVHMWFSTGCPLFISTVLCLKKE